MKIIKLSIIIIIIVSSFNQVFSSEIILNVEEAGGINRIAAPVSSGIPSPAGTDLRNWSLFDATNQEIPVQITKLPGKYEWYLLDFQLDMSANEKKTLFLKNIPPNMVHPERLNINEDNNQITVENGIIKAVVNKSSFNLFNSLWYDNNGNGIFEPAEKIIDSTIQNIRIQDAITNNIYYVNSIPQRIVWEYQGPIRSVLRVEGDYLSTNGQYYMSYTTRITFYAGRTDIKVEQILKNSMQFNERNAKVNSATILLGNGNSYIQSTRPGSTSWINCDGSGLTFELIPSDVWGINTQSNNGIIIPDLSRFSAQILIDLQTNLSGAEKTRRENAVRYPLFALSTPSWYSKYAHLTSTDFATLEDEKNTYNLWGWTWTSDQEPTASIDPEYAICWCYIDVHSDSESDDLWQNILMYLRTGVRGYYDRILGWARYFKNEYVFRTENFDYAWDSSWEPTQVQRTPITIPLTSVDQDYLNSDVNPGRIDFRTHRGCHAYGWGLIDFYYLTGDLDALQAAVDIAEIIERRYLHRQLGDLDMNYYGYRTGARHLLFMTRIWEATLDQRWQTLMDHVADMWLNSPRWDSRGFYYVSDFTVNSVLGASAVGKARGFPSYHMGMLAHAFYLYYLSTANTDIRDRLLAMASWVLQNGIHPVYEYTGKFIGMDYPNPNDVFHNYFLNNPVTFADPVYTVSLIDLLTIGYRLTDDTSYLNAAKYYWDRGSKGIYGDPIGRIAGEFEVGRFLNNEFTNTGVYFRHNKGDLTYAHMFFHDIQDAVSIKNPDNSEINKTFELYQNYPNPFNPKTIIPYYISRYSAVKLEVFNVLGQKVANLIDEFQSPGFYTIEFESNKLPSGIYIYRLGADNFIDIKKMIKVK